LDHVQRIHRARLPEVTGTIGLIYTRRLRAVHPVLVADAQVEEPQPRLRGGMAYETSAFAKRSLTPLTVDANKLFLGGGFLVRMD
jgi:hypothetical protein